MKLILGDCREQLKTLPDNSVDSVVTDPPYELGFMGKKWDNTGIAYNVEMWREVLRVLKPGGHLLSFGGTRTYHRMACAIEDAGFEIRDMIMYVYGSGFPKSLNIFKQLQKKCTCGNMLSYEKEAIQSKQTTKSQMSGVPEVDIQTTKSADEKQDNGVFPQVFKQTKGLEPSLEKGNYTEKSKEDDWREKSSLERGGNLQKTERELQGSDISKMPEGVSADDFYFASG